MAFDFLSSNISFLKENSDFLYNIITTEKPTFPNIQVTRAEGSYINFTLSDGQNKCLLNSLHHKDEQMVKLLNQVDYDIEVLVVFGFECGFFLEEVFKKRPKIGHIIVVEPCLQLFKEVLHRRDIAPVFEKNKSVSIILNRNTKESGDLVAALMQNARQKKTAFVGHITYRTLFPRMFEQIVESARDILFSSSVNLITAYSTLNLYTYNTFKNQKHEGVLAESLFQELRGLKCPAIVVSAGPSLTRELSIIKELQNKALIVAVGTAMRILDKHGIKPHFRVAIDGFPSDCIFEGMDTRSVPLLCSEKIHYDVLGQYQGIIYKMFLDVDRISNFLYQNTGYDQTLVQSGFSVANLTLELLLRLGFKKVILAGQDLCYKNHRLYADGARDNEKVSFDSPGYIKTQNTLGEEVYTTYGFLSMRNLFERIISQYPHAEVINSTEGGLPISGALMMSLSEAMKNTEDEPLLEGLHQRALANQIDKSSMMPAIRENYKKLAAGVNEVLRINEERVDYLKSIIAYEDIDKLNATHSQLSRFESKLKDLEKQMDEVDAYKQVIMPSLANIVANLKDAYAYEGDNVSQKMQSLYKSVMAETTEVHRYAWLLKVLSSELENL